MVSDPATVTRSLSLITTSNGISSFSAPSSSDCEGDAVGSDFNQGNKEMRDTYEIIEQVLSFCPFLLPLNSPFETGFFHVSRSFVLPGINMMNRASHGRCLMRTKILRKRSEPYRYVGAKRRHHLIPDSTRVQCPSRSPSRSISEPPPNAISFMTSCLRWYRFSKHACIRTREGDTHAK